MALDGILLHKIILETENEFPAKINKIYQVSNSEILFQLKCQSGRKNLIISCHTIYNRLNLTERSYPTPEEPSSFVMLLRKHLEGALIQSVEQGGLDRYAKLECHMRNEIGDKVTRYLYIELMGKYANLIFVDSNGKIMDALKRIPPFENNRRTIQPGAMFKETEIQEGKSNPFTTFDYNPELTLTKQFHGFSPFLSKEIEYRLQHDESFKDIMKEIEESKSLYIATIDNEAVFHCIPLKHLEITTKEYPLLEGLDLVYLHKEERDRIKDLSGDIYRFVLKELKHQKQKLPKLQASLEESLDCEKWHTYGDLLYANQHLNSKGEHQIELESFEDSSLLKIPLDPKLDIKGNAKKCFQKYNKAKKGQIFIQEQIDICQKEIDYFEGIQEQLDISSFDDAKEISQELADLGYIKKKVSKIRKNNKKKDTLPKIKRITLDNGIEISYGKNNLQNEALTFKLANKNDMWFHTKDYHGAHVVVHGQDLDEETIRTAAMIASYYSKGRSSSSVPVNYCQVKNLKKIPGAKPGMASLSTYKTIYIDPNESFILNLEK
ncbi:Rqc2 family fibronectin-binding protein [Anaerorhabdus sp.]|uniref:Rqc2 family fibronectin-binding protein n=1 Tax=Anaerorhabdus sp. TaxID=1872524 RepID=UPI002FC9AA58